MMFPNVDDVQKLGREHVDGALKSFGAWNRGVQTIGAEVADHSRTSFETGTATVERLLGATDVVAAVEIQRQYAKSSYEGLLAYSRKIGDLWAETMKESLRPYERALNGVAAQAAE